MCLPQRCIVSAGSSAAPAGAQARCASPRRRQRDNHHVIVQPVRSAAASTDDSRSARGWRLASCRAECRWDSVIVHAGQDCSVISAVYRGSGDLCVWPSKSALLFKGFQHVIEWCYAAFVLGPVCVARGGRTSRPFARPLRGHVPVPRWGMACFRAELPCGPSLAARFAGVSLLALSF